MARKKTTAARKKTTGSQTARKSTAKKADPVRRVRSSRVMILCLIALSWCLCLTALFSLGTAGRILNQLLSLFIGSFVYFALPAIMIYGIWIIYRLKTHEIQGRFIAGLCFLACFWCMAFALVQTTNTDPWRAASLIHSQLSAFFTTGLHTSYGYLGAILAGIFTSLFSTAGAWIFDVAFAMIAALLMGYDWIKENGKDVFHKLFSPVNEEEFEEDSQPHFSFRAKGKGQQKEKEPDNVPVTPLQPSIFNGGIRADFSDFPEEEIVEEQPKSEKKAKRPLPSRHALRQAQEETETHVDETKPSRQESVVEVDQEVIDENIQAADVQAALARYRKPPITLLEDVKGQNRSNLNTRMAKTDGEKLVAILQEFGVSARLGEIHIGPSVTKFEVIPGQGVRVNTIVNLQNDIKMALAATDIRIEAPIPGKSAVGIEVPNAEKTTVSMKELIRSIPERYANLPLVFGLGKDLTGENVYGRLDTMPHLLIAGATGSGKSVCVNSIICSILMRTHPEEVKLLLVDPKKVEFTPYNGVPHLLSPVITDGELAGKALQVIVAMMDKRYDLFEEAAVRNISSYNAWVLQHPDAHHHVLPRIVVIIDELADLMMAAPKDVEQSIQRITQLARAAGIHLIVATQRPSVNVITGVIKANIPARIAFAVSSSTDSRTILDQSGAEKLLGYGDMLFLDNGDTSTRRIQGVFIKDEEVAAIADYVKKQASPMYDDAFVTLKDLQSQGTQVMPENADPLYNDVKSFVISTRKASTSLIQRRFAIGYGRAARIMDILEGNGIIGPSQGSKAREVLVDSPTEDREAERG